MISSQWQTSRKPGFSRLCSNETVRDKKSIRSAFELSERFEELGWRYIFSFSSHVWKLTNNINKENITQRETVICDSSGHKEMFDGRFSFFITQKPIKPLWKSQQLGKKLVVVKLHTGSKDEDEEEKQGGSTIFQSTSICRWMEAKGGRRAERFNLI